MKLHLDSNIAEGSPEELVEYLRLLEEEEEDSPMGYTFWYIDGGVLNHLNVLKTSLYDYFEDSKGRRYTHHAVRDSIKPISRKNAREEFEEAKNNGKLLKYYPAVDFFVREY